MTETTERNRTRPFADWLRDHKKGELHAELSEALADAALASLEHRKTSTVMLKITLKPNQDGVTLFVGDDVTKNLAKGDRGGSTFYCDDEGNMSRSDPRQMSLDDQPLRVVETSDGEAVVLDADTGEVQQIP